MIEKRLSSRLTFFYKFVLPTLWIGLFGSGTAALFLGKMQDKVGNPAPAEIREIFLAVFLIGAPLLVWFCGRLKRVRLSGNDILISNYLTEIRVPISEITEVIDKRLIRPRRITLELRKPTAFGQRITFIAPQWPPTLLFSPHPLVAELTALAKLPIE